MPSNHWSEEVDMKKLTRSLRLGWVHSERIFLQQTGLSPYQYHLQLRINRAREMLHGTTLTVKQVARQLNFENAYHFSKIFKQKAGMSPSRWRHGGGG
jgi:transcriptional regulator GlxA family with amidase domain